MYPAQFDYHRANSVDEALELLAAHEDAELLAGGHSLLPTMKAGLASPDTLVDIGHIDDLQGIDRDGDATTIGALTRYADAVADDDLAEEAPAVAEAAGEIADIQVRNAGTVGGNVAHADPASDLPAAVLVAEATLHAEGPDGERTIDAEDFFLGTYVTALDSHEILTGIELPHLGPNDAGAYVKKPSPSSGYAMIGVATRLHTDGERIESARVAANGAVDHAVRLDSVEEALAGEPLDGDVVGAAEHAAADLDASLLMDDIHASAEYRARLLETYTERALQKCLDRVS